MPTVDLRAPALDLHAPSSQTWGSCGGEEGAAGWKMEERLGGHHRRDEVQPDRLRSFGMALGASLGGGFWLNAVGRTARIFGRPFLEMLLAVRVSYIAFRCAFVLVLLVERWCSRLFEAAGG